MCDTLLEAQGLGWHSRFGTGKGADTMTSGIEGAWKPHPTRWDTGYFEMLFGYEWDLVKSPAEAWQWSARDVQEDHLIPDAHDSSKKHWDYPDSVDRRQGSTGVSVRVLMDTCS